ncbi:MAG: hypothetical protein PVH12_05870 [Candidatus Bathyarchaeota archaeon]
MTVISYFSTIKAVEADLRQLTMFTTNCPKANLPMLKRRKLKDFLRRIESISAIISPKGRCSDVA